MSDRPFRRLSPLTPVVRGFIVVVAAGTTILRDVTRGVGQNERAPLSGFEPATVAFPFDQSMCEH